tara:strand:+ start:1128 stop:1391 length:264 start_codon:yes stop_codon:yes gene_type:complete
MSSNLQCRWQNLSTINSAKEMGEALIHAAEIVEDTGVTAHIVKIGSNDLCLIALTDDNHDCDNCVAIVSTEGVRFPSCAKNLTRRAS